MAEEEKKKGGFLQAIKEFVYGVAAHDSARFALKTRASMNIFLSSLRWETCWVFPFYLHTIL